jgi:hypothetical protein
MLILKRWFALKFMSLQSARNALTWLMVSSAVLTLCLVLRFVQFIPV